MKPCIVYASKFFICFPTNLFNIFLSGLVPGEDAPDIIVNTFLAGVTDEQMAAVGKGFLICNGDELHSFFFYSHLHLWQHHPMLSNLLLNNT